MTLDPDQQQLVRNAAIGLAQGALKPVHDLLLDVCRGAAQEFGEAWKTEVRVWRLERAARLAQKAREFMEPLGINRRDVPLRLFLRTVEEASMEDSDELQDMFAALLASAANPKNPQVHPSFVDILSQLTPRDAKLLILIGKMQVAITNEIPYEPVKTFDIRPRSGEAGFDPSDAAAGEFFLSADTLVRQRLLEPRDISEQRLDGAGSYGGFILTDLAWAFLRAVSPPGSDGWALFNKGELRRG